VVGLRLRLLWLIRTFSVDKCHHWLGIRPWMPSYQPSYWTCDMMMIRAEYSIIYSYPTINHLINCGALEPLTLEQVKYAKQKSVVNFDSQLHTVWSHADGFNWLHICYWVYLTYDGVKLLLSASAHGYKYWVDNLCDITGNGEGTGTHISVFLVILRGEYDDILEWPCKVKVTIVHLF